MSEHWPKSGQSLMDIKNTAYAVHIKWQRKYYEDYRSLTFDYAKCGIAVLTEVINSGHDNIKSDAWFLSGIYLLRQALELGLKSLICRIAPNTPFIQSTFEVCQHDLEQLFQVYSTGKETYLSLDEQAWLSAYLASLELVDKKSDMFRFPFDDAFLSQYRDKFLDNVAVTNNLVQAMDIIEKCLNCGQTSQDDDFDAKLVPTFFVFASHGFGNCYLWQPISDEGFFMKIQGYNDVAQFLFEKCPTITLKEKTFPLLFLLRNSIELGLKQLFYSRTEHGLDRKVFFSKRNSHKIGKDLWPSVRPVIEHYASASGEDVSILSIVESNILEIEKLDKNGDIFRYPTSYSLEYRLDDKTIDILNVYHFMLGIISFLNGCNAMLDNVADFESDVRNDYGYN